MKSFAVFVSSQRVVVELMETDWGKSTEKRCVYMRMLSKTCRVSAKGARLMGRFTQN